jgi:hypothetical protein
MNKTYLFLDDIRDPIHAYGYTNFGPFVTKEWEIVRSYDEFVNHIKSNGLPYFIAFDHDLGQNTYSIGSFWDDEVGLQEKTGFDCAKFLVEYCIDNKKKLPEYYVYSMNPVGKRNIIEYLENYRKHENR